MEKSRFCMLNMKTNKISPVDESTWKAMQSHLREDWEEECSWEEEMQRSFERHLDGKVS